MTTILAIISATIFYRNSMYLSFFMVVVVGLIQIYSKSVMRSYFLSNKAEGLKAIEAAKYIPDGISTLNMWSSFVIYGFSVYAIYNYFI